MIHGIDHCGLAVADLEAARARFAALGFTLTPRETLTKPGPDGAPLDTGADNHVMMFARGYIELIAIRDAAKGHMLLPRLARYMGLHILVLASDDAGADRAAAVSRGAAVTPCMEWARQVAGRGEARFRFYLHADDETPECLLCVVEHLTPDVLRPPDLLRHENGASALTACTLCVADIAEARARYARLLGVAATGDGFRFADGTVLRLTTSNGEGPKAPSFISADIAVAAMARLDASGVPLRRDATSRVLCPGDAFGATIAFST